MAKIRIISGTYGFRASLGIVEPKTPEDEPFEVSEQEAARLVEKGVAAYVGAGPDIIKAEDIVEPEPEKAEELHSEATGITPEDEPEEKSLEDMKFDELKALALSLGLYIKPWVSKKLLRAAIAARQAELPEEDAPDLSAGDAIVD